MARELLISSAKLRAFTDIGTNYNTTDLSNAVEKAQKLELEPIIGKNLYDRLTGSINADGTTTWNTNETTLVDEYIEPYLIQAAYLNILESIYLKPRSTGLGTRSGSAGFTPASRELYNQKRLSIQSEMDFYGNKLVEYLDNNRNTFPQLQANTDLVSDRPDLDTQTNASPLIFNRDKKKYTDKLSNKYYY